MRQGEASARTVAICEFSAMHRDDVFRMGAEFLALQRELNEPRAVFCELYRGDEGDAAKRRLARRAEHDARAPSKERAHASLIVARGPSNAFRVVGAHAYGSVCDAGAWRARVAVAVALLVALGLIIALLRRPPQTPGGGRADTPPWAGAPPPRA